MIQEKIYNTDANSLIKNVIIITLVTSIFLFVVGRFGGNITDKLTEISCKSINEKYIPGDNPGEGMCIKSTGGVDIKN